MPDDINVKNTTPTYPAADTTSTEKTGETASTTTSSTAPRVDAGDGTLQVGVASQADGGPTLILPKQVMNTAVMALVLQDLSSKLSEARIASAKERIDIETKDNQASHEKRAQDIKKSIRSKEKAKHHSKLGKIFGWIGVALLFVAAAVVAVVSGGAAAAPMFGVALLMTGLMIAQETGGMRKLEEAMNLDEKGKLAFMIGITVAMLVISIVATVASGGIAAAGTAAEIADTAAAASEISATAADTAATAGEVSAAAADTAATAGEATSESVEAGTVVSEGVTESTTEGVSEATAETTEVTEESAVEGTTEESSAADSVSDDADANESVDEGDGQKADATKTAKRSATTANKVANRVSNAVNLASGGASIGGGVESIKTAQDEHDEAMADADAYDMQARLEQIAMINQQIIRRIKKILDDMEATTGAVVAILNSSSKATQAEIKAAV